MSDYPVTPAIRFLRDRGIRFITYSYAYEEHGGTRVSSEALGRSEHEIVKTLVFQNENRRPLIVLMHGDREVSTKQMARILGAKKIEPCDAPTAQKHTGYLFGGTSPFGTRIELPVYAEKSIFELPRILINGGKRGFLVEIDPLEIRKHLSSTDVEVAIEK
jgi:Cys-tRNA(Pro) deacylase